MPKYQYEVQQSDNQINTGVIEATSMIEASNWIRAQGGYLLNITPAGSAGDWLEKVRGIRLETGPSLKDILNFTKQLSVMIKAGISIRDAVDAIAEQTQNQKFRKVLAEIKSDVESGLLFSAALAKHPKIFSPLYVNMVRASEMSGTFAHMLERISGYLTQQAETRSMIRGAMIYPAVLFVMSVSAVVFLLTWVLPRFMKVFKGKEQFLPKPTKMLLALSAFMREQWYFLVAGLAVLVIGFLLGIRTKKGKRIWHHALLRIPVIKRMFRAVYITRGLQTMGELINAGVPMLETLEITADISGNVHYQELWLRVRDSVKEGDKIVTPLQGDNKLPRSVVQMIGAGEESGRLGDVLQDVSEFYAKELKDTIKAVTALIEPAMIVFMGFVIGFIAMSIILPVFKMSSLVTK